MSRRDYWTENMVLLNGKHKHSIVDLGYLRAPGTQERGLRMGEMIGKENLQLVAFGRLLARIPKDDLDRVLDLIPQIVPASMKPGYWRTTHSWFDPEGDALKYCI